MFELLNRVRDWMVANASPEDDEAISIIDALESAMESLRSSGPETGSESPVPRTGDVGSAKPLSPSSLGERTVVRSGTLKSQLDPRELFTKIMARVTLHEGWGKKDYAEAISTRSEEYRISKVRDRREELLIEIAAFAISALHSESANSAIS